MTIQFQSQLSEEVSLKVNPIFNPLSTFSPQITQFELEPFSQQKLPFATIAIIKTQKNTRSKKTS
jgi:hypothetical protein